MLTGILHPTAGSARVLGLVPWQQRRGSAARTGTLFGQRSQLWFELSPRQSLRMLAAIYGMDRAAGAAPGRRARRAARRRRPLRPAGARPLPRPADALRARRLPAARAGHPVPRRADHRARPAGQAALPRAARHPQRGARDDGLPHLARRRRHRARRAAGRRHQRRPADLRRLGRRRCAARCCRPSWSTSASSTPVRRSTWTVSRSSPAARRPRSSSVDTSRTSIREVLGRVLDTWSVSDISVVDPPLEQVIAEIYSERRHVSAPLLRRLGVPADVSGRRLLAAARRPGGVGRLLPDRVGVLSALWRAAAGERRRRRGLQRRQRSPGTSSLPKRRPVPSTCG